MNRRNFIGTSILGAITITHFPTLTQNQDSVWIPVMKAGVVNKNGRVYPKHVVEQTETQIKKLSIEKRCLAQLDNTEYVGEVNLMLVAASITDVKLSNDILSVKMELLQTPKGKIIRESLENGIEMGLATCGIGSVDDNNVVKDDYEFTHFSFTNDSAWKGII